MKLIAQAAVHTGTSNYQQGMNSKQQFSALRPRAWLTGVVRLGTPALVESAA